MPPLFLHQLHVSPSPMPAALYKVTPSMLTFLWDECPRCFWLLARRGVYRPSMPFPAIFNKYHDALLRYFLGRCPSELSPALPPGRLLAGEMWVESQPLELPGCRSRLYLKGRLDHLAQFDDGAWGIIDYKMTTTDPAHLRRYARQLHAYAWALERAAPNGLQRTPVARLGLFCLDPVALAAYERDRRVLAELRPAWIEIERRDEAFAVFLARVLRLIEQPAPPPAALGCSCCRYYDRRRELECRLMRHNHTA